MFFAANLFSKPDKFSKIYSCLSRVAASASFQAVLDCAPPVCHWLTYGPLLSPGTSQDSACCGIMMVVHP